MNRSCKKLAVAAGLITLLTLSAEPVLGQTSPLSFEGRLGTTLPIGELSDVGAEAGIAIGGNVLFTPRPNVSLYGGFGWDGFNEEGPAPAEISASGFDVGLKLLFPRPGSATPWARGGLLLYKTEVGEVDSDRSLGLEGAVGIDWALTESFSIVPSARFRRYTPEFDVIEGPAAALNEMDMNYFMIDLAAHLHL